MPASTTALATVRVSGLDVWFGTRRVLHDLDLTVSPGRRTGLVGENGSGKSTLLRALAGTLPSRAVVTGVVDAPGDLVCSARSRRSPMTPQSARCWPARWPATPDGRRRRAALGPTLSDEAGQTAYAAALDLAVAHDAWDADRRAAERPSGSASVRSRRTAGSARCRAASGPGSPWRR